MGFRSGEFAGQSNTPTPWSFNQLLVLLRAPPLAMVLLPGSLYTFPHTYGPWPPWLRAWCPCTVMRRAPIWKADRMRTGPSSDSSPSRVFTFVTPLHREGPISPWMSERAESSDTTAADVGLVSWEWESILFPQLPLMWGWFHVNESAPLHMAAADVGLVTCESECPLHMAAADVGLVSCESECPLHMAAADVGLVSCEWECPSTHGSRWCVADFMWMRVPLYTWQPLMWGW